MKLIANNVEFWNNHDPVTEKYSEGYELQKRTNIKSDGPKINVPTGENLDIQIGDYILRVSVSEWGDVQLLSNPTYTSKPKGTK